MVMFASEITETQYYLDEMDVSTLFVSRAAKFGVASPNKVGDSRYLLLTVAIPMILSTRDMRYSTCVDLLSTYRNNGFQYDINRLFRGSVLLY